MELKFYGSMKDFVDDFKLYVERLKTLNATLPLIHAAIMFIQGVVTEFPGWAMGQRSLLRLGNVPTIDQMIESLLSQEKLVARFRAPGHRITIDRGM